MKIQCISDTHGREWVQYVKECDILLHCGDISPVYLDHSFYTQQQWFYDTFLKELCSLEDKVGNIVFIAGNHDTFLYESFINDKDINQELPKFVHYLVDSKVEINGINIYGTPWCNLPAWGQSGPPVWNFAKCDELLAYEYEKIPEGLDILISHGPAHRFCDQILDKRKIKEKILKGNPQPESLGSKSLFEKIQSLYSKPQYVFSGHIHSAKHQFEKYINSACNVKFRCVSLLNESYEKGYSPFMLNYKMMEN